MKILLLIEIPFKPYMAVGRFPTYVHFANDEDMVSVDKIILPPMSKPPVTK